MRRVEGQPRHRLNEEEKKRERKRQELLNIRSAGSGQAIEQQEGEHINSSLNAQVRKLFIYSRDYENGYTVESNIGVEVNLGGSREQLMRQQTQCNGVVLDDKEYRQRVMEERQRQTQLFSQQPCTQYILGENKATKYKKYNDRRKAERASKKEPVQKVKNTKQVSAIRILCVDSNVKKFMHTRSTAQKARWASVREKKGDMERMTASSDAVTVPKLGLVPKARVHVQPETLYAFLTEEEKYNILLRSGQIKVSWTNQGTSCGGTTKWHFYWWTYSKT
ncbi:hypothetical protein C5167_026068 [Papaver somniferum]|uniref:uncharacterized protein LOC113344023 n=1 Tax=Papaver somniferum TaxID=3469 RepID=UPI000E6F5D8C|nr:uncharacterized protein LOC113344023 [Papaver somniferum]XP_026443879.1 uncharacterized protein LOC113344023 [Papaver somniferum]XP_026443880.1 uncharacterized protein LOC113344023 [Papaver somniferum]XP_026443881.1 uncharacterized protein LOC113344023 [Papaver somniferum]XP_026443882.1 uncharacterized protein LOC113344023 [Papaver somniferum]XP_026443883.1 uncharacterized protein LOC113344023 [Papaver somniferum]RZC93310.1 hypothetical protein C5167_026068 [Papaver somniferum]